MKMPVIFVGHGSPMNAIEDNEFTKTWEELGRSLVKPAGIVVISAHWYTKGSYTSNELEPKMIYDMYGFPKELYDLKYPVKGSDELASKIIEKTSNLISIDNDWGIDHGTWSVLCRMFPDADIPVVQISIDHNKSFREHYEIGKMLKSFRDESILLISSGNVVHNLSLINWGMDDGYSWAKEFDDYIKSNILSKNFDAVINYKNAGSCAEKAFYTPDHYIPLLYMLGSCDLTDNIKTFNDKCLMGAMSMTGYITQ